VTTSTKVSKQPLQVKLGITTSSKTTIHNCTAGTHMHMITDNKANRHYKTTTCKLNTAVFNWTRSRWNLCYKNNCAFYQKNENSM